MIEPRRCDATGVTLPRKTAQSAPVSGDRSSAPGHRARRSKRIA
jgi:hypothetical protein